ncbi:hypothetical protein KW460_05150 [Vibrio fluvialis]|uniref:hypothetical protein n=1 Tax=Vibrio sp. LQ2 TaxID=2883075 RepID=UPI001C9D5370|nr:hypothetical protein [Vibrio sp. LQ2]EKO3425079.1 hypothetical protein [Vibrio fluvialis]EKO3981284.1 hypothetical protein [Vibrio fluvialis]MBY7836452.1 hypothetical protein [Vibrio fluvialis]MBY7870296.1 hypothetical protein [Vibrio fluvialis]USP04187.1 hypothetical protein LGV68_13035 [Vibrio sp. LQ2]
MNKVVIIGTSHSIQWDLERKDFSDYVVTIIKEHCIAAIAEEIDEKPSVLQRVAIEMGLSYLNIEPNAEERADLGIYSNLSMIEYEIFMEFDDHESPEALKETECRKQAGYRLREQEWFNRIKVLNVYPLLVVCGANHVDPFKALLQEKDYIVQVASFLEECT